MRNPETILNHLVKNTSKKDYKFQRLYRNLFNKEFYITAYSRLAPKTGNMTKGTSAITIDGFSLQKIDDLIEQMKTEKYQPRPARRVYIPKSNGKKRPLGIPNFYDKLVQEVIRMILESIYEKTFSKSSHGFRPNKSCHTALAEIKCNFMGSKWFIEGDIHAFFDNINHHILIKLLRKKIDDERFIRLIWKFLRAGYAEEWVFHKTYSGCPQGGIVSPILSNIYLNELDKYMEEYKTKFDKGKARRKNPEYKKLDSKIYSRRQKLKEVGMDSEKRQVIISEIKELREKMLEIPASDQMDPEYKRLYYTRYADDFIIGIIGSKKDAQEIKNDIQKFLEIKLDIELSQEKTLITHSNKFARFLGYDIAVSRNKDVKKIAQGNKKRTRNYQCNLYLSQDVWIKKLKEIGVFRIKKDGTWVPRPRRYLTNLSDVEIINTYNAEIRGLYNYFKFARNVSVLNTFMYFMRYSLYMTFATKYDSSVPKIIKKYSFNRNFRVSYTTQSGEKYLYLYHNGFNMNLRANTSSQLDLVPVTQKYGGTSELTRRLLANQCEWCGTKDGTMEVHHIRKLKDLKGRARWEQIMIARRRKTMILCRTCHKKLHSGKLD